MVRSWKTCDGRILHRSGSQPQLCGRTCREGGASTALTTCSISGFSPTWPEPVGTAGSIEAITVGYILVFEWFLFAIPACTQTKNKGRTTACNAEACPVVHVCVALHASKSTQLHLSDPSIDFVCGFLLIFKYLICKCPKVTRDFIYVHQHIWTKGQQNNL